MDNIIPSNVVAPLRGRSLSRMFALVLSLGAVLLTNLGGRTYSASGANSGVDPLQILDLSIRNNAILVLDSSGSMRDAINYSDPSSASGFADGELAGDDPAAKMAAAKKVLRKIIRDNQTKVSFQFGKYADDPGSFGTGQDFLYSCQESGAVAPEVNCPAGVDRAISNNGFSRSSGEDYTVSGNVFHGLNSGNYLVNKRLRTYVNGGSSTTNCSTNAMIDIPAGENPWSPNPNVVVDGVNLRNNWSLPNNPAGTNPNGPPFVEVVVYTDSTCSTVSSNARFYLRGVQWNKGNSSASCGGFQSLVPLALCDVNDQFTGIAPFIDPEILPLTTATTTGGGLGTLRSAVSTSIRASGFTPIAETLIDIRTIFETDGDLVAGGVQTPMWTTISAQAVKPRTFVIFLTDGDDTCTGPSTSDTSTGGNEVTRALRTAYRAQVLRQGITADVASQVEVFMIAFGGAVTNTINYVAWGGSGMTRATTSSGNATRWASAPADKTGCPTCRDALPATDISQLEQALQAAIDLGSSTGEFSDQQSVTESVFEYVNYAPTAGLPSTVPLPLDPLNPDNRYASSVPVLLQSTFELPEYRGHLNAFRRNDNGTPADPTDDTAVELWNAGLKLSQRVSGGLDGSSGMGTGLYSFAALHAAAGPDTIKASAARIKRRIFTTSGNGVNANYTAQNLLNADFATLGNGRVALWPPSPAVAPTTTATAGVFDGEFGLAALTTVPQVQGFVPGACQGFDQDPSATVAMYLHPECTGGSALARTKREAREIILAFMAGARLETNNGQPVRNTTTKELQFIARPWIMAESTLAAPGVVTPPLLAGPTAGAGAIGVDEYKHYRDGLRESNGNPVDGVMSGLGLRNPDRVDAAASATIRDAAKLNADKKPVMSVVYHATNQGLHALRAGPCPSGVVSVGLGTGAAACDGETGGEELWAFIPYDQLSKVRSFMAVQSRTNKTYLLAAPVRFSDVFVPGAATYPNPSTSFTGVWRTMLYFGRGQGGKYFTALDVTTPGPFTRHSLDTQAPIWVWSRGNPDTTNGVVGGSPNYSPADVVAYGKMGETWSVPGVGFVAAASYNSARKPSGVNFALFAGSGYSDVANEGKTFYVLDALTGDVVRSYDIADGSPAPPVVGAPAPENVPLTNFLVASPVVYSEDTSGNSPSGNRFLGNAIAAKARAVYFPDLHGRIWRFDAGATTLSAPVSFFAVTPGAVGNQPFSTAVSVLQYRPDPAQPGQVFVYAEAGRDRRVTAQAALPFQAYALLDPMTGAANSATLQFARPFEAGYRGNVQPASSFAGTSTAYYPVVFFAGVKFNPPALPAPCISRFDSILIALRGELTTPTAAFDLKATGDDSFIEMQGTYVQAVRVAEEGNLVVDQGLKANLPPPPPGAPIQSVATSTSSSVVGTGLAPGTQMYKDLSPTVVPFRVGSSACRTEYQ